MTTNRFNIPKLITNFWGGGGLIREVCSLEFLALCTMLLPALMAGIGFFFGKTVSPFYFYTSVALLLVVAFGVSWRRGLSYLALLAVCSFLTLYTFSYVGWDAQTYHFPMQRLLHHGWNPVFDSTIEKFDALAGDAYLWHEHTLLLPKFCELCGAIVASALGLFVGDSFLGYILIACLFLTSVKFAGRYWGCKRLLLRVLFAAALVFMPFTLLVFRGYVDYSMYGAFCISTLSLALYIHERRVPDLMLFLASSSICMTVKTTGVLCVGLLVILTLPLLYKRVGYWRSLFAIGIIVAIVGASPLLTNWIQYGSPFYPTMTFNPKVELVDLTRPLTGNADALSMGYLARLCYAWVSPRLAVSVIRLLRGDPSFNPVFEAGVSGIGLWFNAMLLASVVLLCLARKNLVTWLCVVIFVSSNFVPLKFIGHGRHFPQIWMIFPLAALNFICVPRDLAIWRRMRFARKAAVAALVFALCGLVFSLAIRTIAFQGRMLVMERYRQDLIATFPAGRPIRVEGEEYSFTNVQRFRQAGRELAKADGKADTVIDFDSALPCFDTHPEVYADVQARFPCCGIKDLVFKFKWLSVLENLPHVLWD